MLDFLATNPVFQVEEAARRSRLRRSALQGLLRYHVAQGHLLRVRRGLYATVPRGTSPEAANPDSFLIASRMTGDAVLAFHAALECHGRAYSTRRDFTVWSATQVRPFEFRGQSFRAVVPGGGAASRRRMQTGVVEAERQGLTLRVTSLERTLVEALDRPDLAGGWEEVWRSLETVEFFDLDQVVAYVRLLRNATTAGRVGFYLEQHGQALQVDEAHLRPLRRLRPAQPRYMDRSRGGKWVAAWNLVVPQAVFDRSWEEPA
jgi:predicted transcriptional regulator of viral defense system